MHYTDATKNYMVSRSGRVWSLISNKWIKPYVCRDGYQLINLKTALGRRTIRIHRLVLETYVGPCPEGMEACHNNGNKADNRLENLRWDTHYSNIRDKVRHGTYTKGEDHGHAKLTEQQVRQIIYTYRTGLFLQREIAEQYGVLQNNISMIVSKRTWKHLWETK